MKSETEQPKLIALDLGERRIGLAVSGPGGLALPAGHIVRTKLAQDVQQVIASAHERQAQGIVVGIPYTLDGETGPSAKLARGFVRALRRAIGAEESLAIHEMDERYTSVEAEGLLRESGVQPSRDRASVDEVAAVLILQRFLVSQEN
ncbi:MAG: Holliday junction resolvase RuvX [Dehalococcoidia bacterium]|jgi:putative Holliday junction resolvase|nr:Holliday junction resolvase RuvX [Dehalococcoidia bacterium]